MNMATDKKEGSSSITVWSFPAFNFAIFCSVVADAHTSTVTGVIMWPLSVALPSSFVWAVLVELGYKSKQANRAVMIFAVLTLLFSYLVICFCFEVVADSRISVTIFTIVALSGFGTLSYLAWLSDRMKKKISSQKDGAEGENATPPNEA